MYILRCWYCKP